MFRGLSQIELEVVHLLRTRICTCRPAEMPTFDQLSPEAAGFWRRALHVGFHWIDDQPIRISEGIGDKCKWLVGLYLKDITVDISVDSEGFYNNCIIVTKSCAD